MRSIAIDCGLYWALQCN